MNYNAFSENGERYGCHHSVSLRRGQQLRAETPDLDMQANEAVALDLFRKGKLSHFELSRVLGLDRFESDAYLKRHNVFEGSLTMEDLEADRQTLERVLGPVQRPCSLSPTVPRSSSSYLD